MKAVPAETVLRAVLTVGPKDGEIVDQHVVKNPQTGGWRLTFQVRPKTDQPVELRAFLQKGDEALTETWSYLLHP